MNILFILFGTIYAIAISMIAVYYCDKFRSLVRTKGKSANKKARIRQ